jgi:DNA-binding transcriptional ArsR family regulator
VVDVLQVVAEPRRRQILSLVWEHELAAGEIAGHFDMTFGAVSQHLAVLRGAGLVSVRRDGNRRFYTADKEALGPLRPMLEAMWRDTLDRLADSIEGQEP